MSADDAVEGEPLWISDSFKKWFEDHILSTYTRPQYYEDRLVPMPFLHAVYGRLGVGKLRAIKELLAPHKNISYHVVTVKIGETQDALDQIFIAMDAAVECDDRLMEQQNADQLGTLGTDMNLNGCLPCGLVRPPIHMIIVDHIHHLIYEPDNEVARLNTLKIKQRAEQCRVAVVGLFDKVPGDVRGFSNVSLEIHDLFFHNFSNKGYAASPHKDFRITFFKWIIDRFVTHLKAVGRPLEVSLVEDDYIHLANCSTYATQQNITEYIRKVFLDIVQTAETTVLDLNFLVSHMSTASSGYHICHADTYEIEQQFSLTCGKGFGVRPDENKVVKSNEAAVVDDPNGPTVAISVTSFNGESASIKNVFDQLASVKTEVDKEIAIKVEEEGVITAEEKGVAIKTDDHKRSREEEENDELVKKQKPEEN